MAVPVSLDTELRSLRLPELLALPAEASVLEAARAMLDAGLTAALLEARPCAIVTERDVVRATVEHRPLHTPALAVATPNPLVVPATASLSEAAQTMRLHRVGHLLVIDVELRPVSIVSARDLADLLVEIVGQPAWLHALRRSLRTE